ncbi:hypothetical protein NDU88_002981 [Pleurodeles waltl]|uniref:Uncharacterized protein n=1 Tax=Pleurodeles waltl TaxID=8319 RepID=A0AAV7VC55_PLEWA|nr:hypothetical protein NDU88_002981 [Pleurodeles waltl]
MQQRVWPRWRSDKTRLLELRRPGLEQLHGGPGHSLFERPRVVEVAGATSGRMGRSEFTRGGLRGWAWMGGGGGA